ncbi:ATP-binding protein [Flavobacterium soli]|uniref:ATP-binding protein n=1 Tax=Flavobacterium soli TaxID=344881 RepID=UPI00040337B5|nr:tetratricopeptide repeat protein [Flavobacterium soli]
MLQKTATNHHILYVILLFCTMFAHAQDNKIATLLQELTPDAPDTTRLRVLKRLSTAYTSVDPEKKYQYANKYRLLATEMGVDTLVAHGYMDMGTSHGMRNNLDSALFYFDKGLAVSEKINYKAGIARALSNIGYAYDRLDNKEGAIKNILQALEMFKQVKHKKGINQCYVNLGALYFDIGQYKFAESYFKLALQKYTEAKDNTGIAHCLFTLGGTYKALKQYEKAKDYYQRSLKMADEFNIPAEIALARWGLGQMDVIDKNYKKALSQFEIALKINREVQNEYHKDAVLISMADAYLSLKEYQKAEACVMEAYNDSKISKSGAIKTQSLEVLVALNKAQRNFEKALEYQTDFIAINDSIALEKTTKNVVLTDFDRVRSENDHLLENNTKITKKNTSYVKAIFITSIMLLFVVILLALYYKRNNDKKAINHLLQEQKDEIASINKELEILNKEAVAKNAELEQLNNVKNKFFSIVSHDLRSPLSTLKMLFGLYRQGQLNEHELNELLSRLEHTIFNTAVFLDNLLEWSKNQLEGIIVKPESFDVKELVDANIRLLDSQIRIKNLRVENTILTPITAFADPNMINLVLRNLLSNAVKFCNANDLISIKAEAKDDLLVICIRDTGPGINEKDLAKLFSLEHTTTTNNTGEKGHQLGLVLCKDMVEQNKGAIRVESKEGEGTVFCIDLPKFQNKL